MIDLHMHTTCSDGQFSPEETMRMAHEAGVTVAAVTDHDTASGILRARAAAEQYGMTVYVNSATTLEQQYQEILDLGLIFGVEDKAEAFVEDQKSRIAAVQEKVKDREPLKVLVYDSGNDGVFTCSGSNFESLLIGLAGGENLFDDLSEKQWVTVSYEEVLAREPDIILIHDYDSPSVEEKIAEIKANPTLSQLDCVQNERFATITLESVLPGDRMAYAVESLAAVFYPEVFGN